MTIVETKEKYNTSWIKPFLMGSLAGILIAGSGLGGAFFSYWYNTRGYNAVHPDVKSLANGLVDTCRKPFIWFGDFNSVGCNNIKSGIANFAKTSIFIVPSSNVEVAPKTVSWFWDGSTAQASTVPLPDKHINEAPPVPKFKFESIKTYTKDGQASKRIERISMQRNKNDMFASVSPKLVRGEKLFKKLAPKNAPVAWWHAIKNNAHKVPPALLVAQIYAESSFNQNARNGIHYGFGQFNQGTWDYMNCKGYRGNPIHSIDCMATYDAHLFKQYKNWSTVLYAYNGGLTKEGIAQASINYRNSILNLVESVGGSF